MQPVHAVLHTAYMYSCIGFARNSSSASFCIEIVDRCTRYGNPGVGDAGTGNGKLFGICHLVQCLRTWPQIDSFFLRSLSSRALECDSDDGIDGIDQVLKDDCEGFQL
jgi:hypothetical protein